MKHDGRKLDHRTLEAIRRMALERVREGEAPSRVIASYGFHRTVIYRWLKAAAGRGRSLRALASRKAGGRPRKLSAAQERQVFRWINGKNPTQYGFDFSLWTRQGVSELVQREFGVALSLASVGTMLARLGLTAQKPLQRAYERDPQAIGRWKHESFAAIARQARAEHAEVYFWDESGFRANAVQGKTWDVKGQMPVVQAPGRRQNVSAASAVNTKGAFWFATYPGALTSERFVELLKKLMHRRSRPLHLVLDGSPAHRKAIVGQYVKRTQGRLTLHFLPDHAPEPDPDELAWSHARRMGNARRALRTGEKLDARMNAQPGRKPVPVRSLSGYPDVSCIIDS